MTKKNGLKILVAPDSFKESLSANKVADHIGKGISKFGTNHEVIRHPMSDGGEGMLDTVLVAEPGQKILVDTLDPLGRPIKAAYGLLQNKSTAIVEMALASGIGLIEPARRTILSTSTFGTGILIREALDDGAKRIIIGLGGSGTNDGGMGLASALGIRFLSSSGMEIPVGGGFLSQLHKIDISGLDLRIFDCEIIGACDVQNKLTGPAGATSVYGPQKGGTAAEVILVDSNLKHYAKIIERDLGTKVLDLAGAGAAGGTGAAVFAFLRGKLEPGFPIIAELTGLEAKIKDADLVITGEGSFDSQSHFGKTPIGVVDLCCKHSKPVVVIAGRIESSVEFQKSSGITLSYSLMEPGMTLQESISRTGELLESAAFRACSDFTDTKN